jgi:ankyrin repeat protein
MKILLRTLICMAFCLAAAATKADAVVDFFRAVNVDDAGTVADLLKRGFDPNAVDDKGQAALHLSLRDDSPRVTAALLAHPQIRFDAANAHDETPLMMAALRGRMDWANNLLGRGAQVNRPGWTPLHYAATGPETAMVKLMLDRGALIEAPSPNQTTALMMAARYGPETSVDLLLQRGANPRAQNMQGLNAADFARLGGREALTARLAEAAR